MMWNPSNNAPLRLAEVDSMLNDNLLVVGALALILIVVVVGGIVIWKEKGSSNVEITKIRFAAATFTGILALIVLVVILYYIDPDGAGKQIFLAVFPAVNALAGGIIGYLFGSKN
jgi:hypothetical protein